MFNPFKALFSRKGPDATATGVRLNALSGDLPSPQLPKSVSKKQAALPSYLTVATPPTNSPLIRKDRLLANKDILDYRIGADSRQVIRDFTRADPNLSAAVTGYIRTGITSGYTAVARNLDGTINPDGTNALSQVISRMNVLNDYTIGYDDGRSIRSLSEAWAREIITGGAMCGELVLDKLRLPSHFHPIASSQIRLFPSSDARKLVPKQFLAGNYIDLDVPTFFMVTLDEDLTDPYPISPIETAIQGVLFAAEFMNDVRRVIKRAIHPRYIVTLDEEKFKKTIPADAQGDVEKLNEYMATVLADVENKINALKPEETLIVFDVMTIEVVDHGNTNLAKEYETVQGMADAKVAAGSKTLPTILGRTDGTANTASAEVLLFMKFVEGTVWAKLNEMFSKMFTLAVRLMGHDVYVDFKYNEIDLKPASELESFKQMKQSRILALLSLGLMTDEQACIELTGALPPAGAPKLSGTNFMPAVTVTATGDGQNGESKQSTINNAARPTTPTKPAGGTGKPKAELELVS